VDRVTRTTLHWFPAHAPVDPNPATPRGVSASLYGGQSTYVFKPAPLPVIQSNSSPRLIEIDSGVARLATPASA